MKSILRWVCAGVMLVLVLSAQAGQEQQVEEAIARLQTRTTQNAFVVFKHEESRRYVQFANRNGKLVFDFPLEARVPPEMGPSKMRGPYAERPAIAGETIHRVYISETIQSRLAKVLARHSLPMRPFYETILSDEGKPVGWMMNFGGPMPGTAASVRQFVYEVFREVFELKGDLKLTILEN
ncbi:MAG: hypothetical protein AABZ50_05190 [Pseudomonadota bacterium]